MSAQYTISHPLGDETQTTPQTDQKQKSRTATIIGLILLIVLIILSYSSYTWLKKDMEKRRYLAQVGEYADMKSEAVEEDISKIIAKAAIERENQNAKQEIEAQQAFEQNAYIPQIQLVKAKSKAEKASICAYLLAEITRLDFEFGQNLPPPVIDHISSNLAYLRTLHKDQSCPQLPAKLAG